MLEREGHTWIGCDISKDMLNIAEERDNEGDVFALDMGVGMPFRYVEPRWTIGIVLRFGCAQYK